MLASASVLGRAELGSFGVVICVGIDMFIVSFTVQFACLCDNMFACQTQESWSQASKNKFFALNCASV